MNFGDKVKEEKPRNAAPKKRITPTQCQSSRQYPSTTEIEKVTRQVESLLERVRSLEEEVQHLCEALLEQEDSMDNTADEDERS